MKKRTKTRCWSTEHFEVKKSSIVGAGKGLFSKMLVKSGDTIGEYTGKVLTDNQTERKPYINSEYILWVCKDHNILGEGHLSNHTRFINHNDKTNGRIVTSTRWKKARIEATKVIHPGQEIFIDYGNSYWQT